MKNFTLNILVAILALLLVFFGGVCLAYSVLGIATKEWLIPRVIGISLIATFLSGIPLGIVMFISFSRTPQHSDMHDPVQLLPGLAFTVVFLGSYLLYLIAVVVFDISNLAKLKAVHLIISSSLALSWWFFCVMLFGNLGFCFSKRSEPPSFD